MTVCTEANAFCQFLLDSLGVVPFADSAGNIEFFFIRVKMMRNKAARLFFATGQTTLRAKLVNKPLCHFPGSLIVAPNNLEMTRFKLGIAGHSLSVILALVFSACCATFPWYILLAHYSSTPLTTG
jgi:hypothetical protein